MLCSKHPHLSFISVYRRPLFLLLLVSGLLVTIEIIKSVTKTPSFQKYSDLFTSVSKSVPSVSKSASSVAKSVPVFNHRLTESDLLHLKPIKVDIQLLKKEYFDKIKDMKRNNVWKRSPERELCVKDNIVRGIVCEDRACNSSLPPADSDANFASLTKPLSRVKVKVAGLLESVKAITNISHVTFVTGASSNHFMESQALLKNLHLTVFPHLKNFTFYYYDLGLSREQRLQCNGNARIHNELSFHHIPSENKSALRKQWIIAIRRDEGPFFQLIKYCRCEVRSYPFHLLPKRFAYLKGYTWKPMIIQAHLPYTDILVWIDSSIRFKTGDLEPMFEWAKHTGLLLINDHYGVSEHTSKTTFDFFGDKTCEYSLYNECQGGFLVMHNEPFIRDVFLRVWWACAIDPECMYREQDKKRMYCNTKIRKYNKCHRFDQSVISILLAKLFRENTESFFVQLKYHSVKRGHKENYFKELEAKIT